MFKKRLLELADLLDANDGEHFSMEEWYHTNPECGYTACAVGTALFHKPFREQGLSCEKTEEGDLNPIYQSKSNWQAVEAFFGLEKKDAEFLFSPKSYETGDKTGPGVVANRIRELVGA